MHQRRTLQLSLLLSLARRGGEMDLYCIMENNEEKVKEGPAQKIIE